MPIKILIILLLLLSTFKIPLFAADKIVAIVNKDIITQSELDTYLNIITFQLTQEYSGKELEEKINEEKKGLIQKMIEDKIILQEAKNKGFQVRPDKLKHRIEQMKEGFSSQADFEDAIRKKGLSPNDLESKLGDQIIMREIVERQVKDKIVISPEEVTEFYEKHKDEFLQPEKRSVDLLYTEKEEILDSLIQDLKGGLDFQSAAKKYEASYSKDNVSKQQMRPEIADAIFSLNLNQMTSPIKIDNGFYIFKLTEISQQKIEDLVTAHNKICNWLFQEKFAQKMSQWLEDLKAKSYIEIKQR